MVHLFCALLAWFPGTALSSDQTGPAQWEQEIQAFEASDRTNPPPKGGILFVGSSSIRLWKTLARDFAAYPVINRGFGGSEIADCVYFAERIVFPHEPRMVVMFAGGNDLHRGKTPEQVADDFSAFVTKVRARLPAVRIAYISVTPTPARWEELEKIRTLNRLIEQGCNKNAALAFINLFPHLLGEDGLPRPEIFQEDRLHMNVKGYEIWTRTVRPFLAPPAPSSLRLQ